MIFKWLKSTRGALHLPPLSHSALFIFSLKSEVEFGLFLDKYQGVLNIGRNMHHWFRVDGCPPFSSHNLQTSQAPLQSQEEDTSFLMIAASSQRGCPQGNHGLVARGSE